jgi:hypothetical protein
MQTVQKQMVPAVGQGLVSVLGQRTDAPSATDIQQEQLRQLNVWVSEAELFGEVRIGIVRAPSCALSLDATATVRQASVTLPVPWGTRARPIERLPNILS